MKIIVPVKFVPDLVEELTIDSNGTALDTAWLRLIINESDDHAVEQAHRGGLAGAVVAQEAEDLSRAHFKRKVVYGNGLLEMAGELVDGDN